MYIHIKQLVTYIGFLVFIILFMYLCIFGVNGLLKLYNLEMENKKILQELHKHEQLLEELRTKVALWQESDFLKEKQAREKLHMARKDDMVYCIQS